AEVSEKSVPVSCMPSPESPEKRITTSCNSRTLVFSMSCFGLVGFRKTILQIYKFIVSLFPGDDFFRGFPAAFCAGVFVFGDNMCVIGGFRLLFRSENARFCMNSKAGSFLNFFGMPPSSVEEREGVIRMNHAKALAVALDC
ncbi:MAG: hypothetical protein ACLUNN_10815, partial [Alistipes finegoldii]